MFDFDDLETTDPTVNSLEDEAAAAAELLNSQAFTERRDACRALAQLKAAAEPYLPRLLEVCESDEDYEVRKAAKTALRTLRVSGISLAEAKKPPKEDSFKRPRLHEKQGPQEELFFSDWQGPKVVFDINGQILEMCLEHQVTPKEITEIWESWRLHYTKRIRFVVTHGDEARSLLRDEPIPLLPEVVKLEVAVGSVLLPLAGVLREFGHLPPKEAAPCRLMVFRCRSWCILVLMKAAARESLQYESVEQLEKHHHPWKYLPWQAQFAQDRRLVELIFRNRRHGFFIELGASDGKTGSNTYALEIGNKWSGLLIDAFEHEDCKKNRPGSTCVEACVAGSEKARVILENGMRSVLVEFLNEHMNFTPSLRNCTTLPKILKKHKAPRRIDWLSLDVEGAELEILRPLLDEPAYLVDVISLETWPGNKEKYAEFMHRRGYRLMERLGLDDVYVREWSSDQAYCKEASVSSSLQTTVRNALLIMGSSRQEGDAWKSLKRARNSSRAVLERVSRLARKKDCKTGELSIRLLNLLFDTTDQFVQDVCSGIGLEGEEILNLVHPMHPLDKCSPFFSLSFSRMSFLALVQSDWPIFDLLDMLATKMYQKTFGPLQECAALGIEVNATVLQYADHIRGQSMICGAFHSAVNCLQRALASSPSDGTFFQLIQQAESRLKGIALQMQVWDHFAVAGQLRKEENPYRLLSQLQRSWLTYRSSNPEARLVTM
ncbi:unnamed protein product [Durusdinium trenchii]|uniref:Methyltransferase FkbM domain-containing protein n=1 Tax=Durusdinium trenchii TaxID=1381693 RepID=A0ABP0PDR7_9DINO